MIKKGSLVRLRLDGHSGYLYLNRNSKFEVGDYALITGKKESRVPFFLGKMYYYPISKPFNSSIKDEIFDGHIVEVLSVKCMAKINEIINTTLKKKNLKDYKPIKLISIDEEETGVSLSILFKNKKDKFVQLNISNVKKIKEIDVII